jgi:hypothetical protein
MFALAVVLLLGSMVGGLLWQTGTDAIVSALWAVGSVIVILLSLHRFFLPSWYEIDAAGVCVRTIFGRQHISWQDIRRFEHGSRGAVLGRRARSRVGAGRDLHLLFEPDQREAVIAAIETNVQPAVEVAA